MNKTKLKNYAPEARKDFIAAVTARANQLGLSSNCGSLVVSPVTRQGDVTLIEGRDWPVKVFGQRERLVKRMQRDGFQQTIEAVAYTWFNRFAALRYMELHDYLEHGYRVLSSSSSTEGIANTPDVLLHAVDLAQSKNLPGLNVDEIGRLKLAGNQDGELYRKLLIAQCNAVSNVMPFLFERIDDETELLLPDNLLRTDSVIAKLVAEIPEEDWQEVEIIGWLYQFYISEKKDEVIGKVVKSEDIPAATQLFTPNWIVQYLVQNSVGRLWMMANANSTLKSQWRYYIEPAEQTSEVDAQLDALIKTRMDEDGGSLNPESITVLDPACGSGHILVEAYDLLKGIYLERGYRLRDIPRLILERNLYGLDIDDRAAQMAGFALLMKARSDDRRLFDAPIKLNLLSIQESRISDLEELATHLVPHGLKRSTLKALLDIFSSAKAFGSLIKISDNFNEELNDFSREILKLAKDGDVFSRAIARELLPLINQAVVLSMNFDVVVANPPYMGSNYFNSEVRDFVGENYKVAKGDLYACFITRCNDFCKQNSFVGMVTIPNWMFISSFQDLRDWLLSTAAIETLSHNGRGVFGSDFGSVAFTWRKSRLPDYKGSYKRLFDKQGSVSSNEDLNAAYFSSTPYVVSSSDFEKIPGCPIAYWASKKIADSFSQWNSISHLYSAKTGMTTGDDKRFLRLWFEVSNDSVGSACKDIEEVVGKKYKWVPYNKGGVGYRWYGHCNNIVKWKNNGEEIKHWVVNNPNDPKTKSWSRRIFNHEYFFKPGVTWTLLNSGSFNVRELQPGNVLNVNGPTISVENEDERLYLMAYLNSTLVFKMMNCISPTLTNNPGEVEKLPFIKLEDRRVVELAKKCRDISKLFWNDYETSTEFRSMSLVSLRANEARKTYSLLDDYLYISKTFENFLNDICSAETDINRIFSSACGLDSELNNDFPRSELTLPTPNSEKDCQRLISYAVGCMMGRYSLDEPGLIYAHAENIGFDVARYKTFKADSDGIVPLTEELWFEDDAANCVREFLIAIWGTQMLDENLAWIAESLGKKTSDTSENAIRRYLADNFFKDHLQAYKKRPIYWLFSSGKQGAFKALVYLHRYHEGTLARMRSEYVVPLTGKIQTRIEMLNKDAQSASSTAARNKINKEIEKFKKQYVELLAYDEKLRHYADMRIKLDLDDGVKVNYGRFGDLLDSVKAITGGSDE